MATTKQLQFISTITPLIQKYAPQYGISVASPIIAQSINESAYGESDLGIRHNYFGLKCRSNWTGKRYSKVTQEEYVVGDVVDIVDCFRVFDSMEEGVKGYFEFLFDPIVKGLYDNLKGVTDPYEYCRLIKEDGYCTRSNYVQELTNLINTYNLRQYDTMQVLGGNQVAKLYVVAGHGGGDSGAVGHGFNEAERVRTLAAAMKKLGGDQVILGDTSINWYATRKFSTLANPGCPVLELHMDSYETGSPKGGHVIIKSGFSADAYDNALANYISTTFPGRASKIVSRSDLQNVNLCAQRGINYRLLEVCFITNYDDLMFFNSHIDQIAQGILSCFGISTKADPEPSVPEITGPQRRHDVAVGTYDDSDAQKWWMRQNEDGTVALRNASCWDWLSDPNSSTTIAPAQVWGGQGGDDGNRDPRSPQLLVLESLGDGLYRIHPKVAPNLSLDVANGSKLSGAKVQWYPTNDSEAQKWFIYSDEDKSFRILNVGAFKALECPGGGYIV